MERDTNDLGAANTESGSQVGPMPTGFPDQDVEHLLAEAGRAWDALQSDLEDHGLHGRV